MSELRLVRDEEADGPFSAGTPLPTRLPRGRHGIPSGIVAEHQRLRLLKAMAEALAEHGYAEVNTTHVSERAGVSTATFYKHFGNLWDCALAAYVAGADRLCTEIAAACAADGDDGDAPIAASVEAALSLLAAEPALGLLLSTQAPREASALCAARRLLVSRLAAMLRRGRGSERDAGPKPPALDERLIDATLAFVHARIAAGRAEQLPAVGGELVAILNRPRSMTYR